MTKDEILEIQIILKIIVQDKTIKEWLDYFESNVGRKCLHVVYLNNGNFIIKTDAMCANAYVPIFEGHYSTFEDLVNSMKFFRQMFRQH